MFVDVCPNTSLPCQKSLNVILFKTLITKLSIWKKISSLHFKPREINNNRFVTLLLAFSTSPALQKKPTPHFLVISPTYPLTNETMSRSFTKAHQSRKLISQKIIIPSKPENNRANPPNRYFNRWLPFEQFNPHSTADSLSLIYWTKVLKDLPLWIAEFEKIGSAWSTDLDRHRIIKKGAFCGVVERESN